MSRAILAYFKVGQVTSMWALRVFETMLFAERIIMFSGRSERWTNTFPFIVDVDAMQTRLQSFHVNFDVNRAIFTNNERYISGGLHYILYIKNFRITFVSYQLLYY